MGSCLVAPSEQRPTRPGVNGRTSLCIQLLLATLSMPTFAREAFQSKPQRLFLSKLPRKYVCATK